MAQTNEPPIFSAMNLERAIEEEFRSRLPVRETVLTPAVSAPPLSMPDYVEHRKGVTEIGKLSAEAVVREYETAAKDIENMGVELIERVRQCEDMARGALAAIDEMKQTAAHYRAEAKRLFLEIEDCSLVTAEVRTICNELTEKIGIKATTQKQKQEQEQEKTEPPSNTEF